MTAIKQARPSKRQILRKKLRTLPLAAYIEMMTPYWVMARIVGHYCKVSYNERLN